MITDLLGPHAGFIIACYAMTALVLAGLVGWILLDHRTQRRRLAAMEAQGIRRRSSRGASATTEGSPL